MAERTEYPPKRRYINGGKQTRNRHSSAGITAREADSLYKYMRQIRKISSKKNLYIGYENRLLKAAQEIEDVLRDAGRLE